MNTTIKVEKVPSKPVWKVKLDKKVVGEIRYEDLMFEYFPKGSNIGGGKRTTLDAIIRSLGEE